MSETHISWNELRLLTGIREELRRAEQTQLSEDMVERARTALEKIVDPIDIVADEVVDFAEKPERS